MKILILQFFLTASFSLFLQIFLVLKQSEKTFCHPSVNTDEHDVQSSLLNKQLHYPLHKNSLLSLNWSHRQNWRKRLNSKNKIPHSYIRISIFVRLQLDVSYIHCLTNKNEFCSSNLELVREVSGPSYIGNVFRA